MTAKSTVQHVEEIVAFVFAEVGVRPAAGNPFVDLLKEELWTRLDEAVLDGIREYRTGLGLDCEEP